MMRRYHIWLLLPLLAGCQKYATRPDMSKPAYIRVFNDIAVTPTLLNNGNLNNFLTFVMDPVPDAKGAPATGAIVEDFMVTRQSYTISYPTDAANTVAGSSDTNYEYPGREHVLTAPALNGFDCSSWAQITAGRHRFVFVSRPGNNQPFDSLTTVQRSKVIIDTTVDLSAGELYTVEAVLTNVETNTYSAYIRQEQFIHQHYDPDSVYTAVFNLSAIIDSSDINPYSSYWEWFSSNLTATGTAYVYDYAYKDFDTVPGYVNVTLPIGAPFSTSPSYLVFPLPPLSDFFDLQGYVGTYGQLYAINASPQNDPGFLGTLPMQTITIGPLYSSLPYVLYCWASPVNYNNLKTQSPFNEQSAIVPNLYLVSTLGSTVSVYPTINIMEIINNQVYLTQIQKGFNTVPQ